MCPSVRAAAAEVAAVDEKRAAGAERHFRRGVLARERGHEALDLDAATFDRHPTRAAAHALGDDVGVRVDDDGRLGEARGADGNRAAALVRRGAVEDDGGEARRPKCAAHAGAERARGARMVRLGPERTLPSTLAAPAETMVTSPPRALAAPASMVVPLASVTLPPAGALRAPP